MSGSVATRAIHSSGASGLSIRAPSVTAFRWPTGPRWNSPYVSPDRCVNRSRKVIGRFASSVASSGPSGSRSTRTWASSGAQISMASSSANRPSSSSIKAATVVTGLVIEAMRKMVSRSTGRSCARSRRPTAAVWTTSPLRQASVAAPASRPVSTRSPSTDSTVFADFVLNILNKCTILMRMASRKFPIERTPSRRGKPKGDKRARTRAALFDAARTLIREKGYERTTMEEVARRAGMTTGAIYGNFKNRDELFIALAQEYWAPIAPKVAPGATFAEAMRALAAATIAAVDERAPAAVGRLTGIAYTLSNAELRARVHDVTKASYEFGAEWLGTFDPKEL